tara:strand:+ start:909 stop:1418 length:510 start_codon:yes stop_codon:yes gene_type:complete
MSSNECSSKKKNVISKKRFEYTDSILEQFCYLYDSEKYKYAVVCIDAKHFVKIKLKKNPNGYDKVYAHMVKILQNALKIANEKYNSQEFIVFVDMKGSGMKQFDITFSKTLIVILENTFTDNLKYCIVKNAPRLFKMIYKIIYPFIDKDTRKKFMFEKKGKISKINIEN